MPPPGSESDLWYRTHILPHEPMLRAWLHGRFPSEPDVDDVIQEAVLRVLKARAAGEIRSPKAFFFATARNLVLGTFRKNARHGQFGLAEWDELDVLDGSADVTAIVAHAEELELLTQAIQSLPARCRQVITLRKIYGMSQKEIARELGISVNTVETQATIGMHKLAAYFEHAGAHRRPCIR